MMRVHEHAVLSRKEANGQRNVAARPTVTPHQKPALVIQRKCACGGSCPRCQEEEGHPIFKKSRLSGPVDAHELEADQIADHVLRGGRFSGATVSPIEQPRASEDLAPPLVGDVLRSPGRPLDAGTRAYMESRLGSDLGLVRIHDDSYAAASARSVDALAYTVNRHVVFGEGQYRPHSESGKRLLAHELVHTMQQKSAAPRLMRQHVGGHSGGHGGGPGPAPRRCGPNVTGEIGRVWGRIESDFAGWTPTAKSDACLHLVWPLVNAGNERLFWPFVAGRLHLPSSGTISDVLREGLAAGVELGRWADYGARMIDSAAGTSLGKAIDWAHLFDFRDLFAFRPDVVYNKNNFDTLGLFNECIGWLARPPVLRAGCCSPQPTGSQSIEEDTLCSGTVQAGSECWLSGTVNYGTFGVMMRLCANWGDVLTELALRVADPRIRTLPAPLQIMARAVVVEAARAWTAALFSQMATNMVVQIYKRIDGDDPGPPSRWAQATYTSGHSGTESGGNRPNCPPDCPSTVPVPHFDYVWETAKHRPSGCPPGLFVTSGKIPPSKA